MQDKRAGKSASTQAGEFVKDEIDKIRKGKHGARSTKQAINEMAIHICDGRAGALLHVRAPAGGFISRPIQHRPSTGVIRFARP
ncbi:hypothetical protein ACFPFP_18920 [Bradyrhizobium sp. GCM10023182]|uniref:Uncharacterized protein n=1 Tax=Bradyrhizobium zhengyangense TaxID=2911009 RepID=A0ABS9LQQ9_9BRAD|nr:hypothetical protein [Bradyrhizobium zhengyangense]MCG2638646.1 hypothetical protein [Bradyrhizobium zhengyangense]MCG2669027.1 hypothetical protein [Bradyrhizobium zhengyangense]